MRGFFSKLFLVLLIIVSGFLIFYVFLYEKDDNSLYGDESYNSFNINDLDKISNAIKDYSYKRHLADESNIESWDFTNIEFYGYFEDDKNLEYYEITGTYLCKDSSYDCIYMKKSGSMNNKKYIYKTYASFRKEKGLYILESVEPNLEFAIPIVRKEQGGFRNTGYEYDKLVDLYKEYIIANGMALKSLINDWKVELIYLGKNNGNLVFNVINAYSCINKDNSCILNSNNKNSFEFETLVIMKKGLDGIYYFEQYNEKELKSIENPVLKEDIDNNIITRDSLSDQFRQYYYDNELAFKDNVENFDITYIIYKGELKEKHGIYIVNANISYKCVDETGSCVVSDVKKDPNSNLYTFVVEFYLSVNQKGTYDISVKDINKNEETIGDSLVLQ